MAQETWQRAQRFWTSHQIALTLIQLSIHGLLCLGLNMLHVGWWISVLISRAENFCFYVSVVSPDLMSKWQIQLRDCTCIWQQPVSHMTGLLYWTRIYKVNFKFCNTLSNNMGKLFPQTKNLKKKKPSKFKHLPCAGDHKTFLHVQYMYCTWLRAVSAARRTLHNIWEAVLMLWLIDYSFSL